MGLQDPINKSDAINLKSIQKKLNLPLRKLAKASALQRDSSLTNDEKTRHLLDIPEGIPTMEFLRERLNEREIITIGKFVKLEG